MLNKYLLGVFGSLLLPGEKEEGGLVPFTGIISELGPAPFPIHLYLFTVFCIKDVVLLPSNKNKRHVPFFFKLGKWAQLSSRGSGPLPMVEDHCLVYNIEGNNIVSFIG